MAKQFKQINSNIAEFSGSQLQQLHDQSSRFVAMIKPRRHHKVVLVTGASGFIATHVVQQLQQSGFRVRGTVRSLHNDAKVQPLYGLCPDAKHKLELVEADLTKPETWESAVQGCGYVIHMASPFPNAEPRTESEVIEPAVQGTLAVLQACVAARVRRVVLTSSIAAVAGFGESQDEDNQKIYCEEDWTDATQASAYVKSKTLAEKAAWSYVKQLPEEERFELAVINPVLVMGPVLQGSTCTSMEVPCRLLERAMPALPRLYFTICDVRDVAAAHLKAMVHPEAAGQRHIVSSGGMWMKEVAEIMDKEFACQGYNVPTTNAPYALVWITGLFDKTIRMILPNIGKTQQLNTARMREVLDIKPRDLRETILDMSYSLIERGFVHKTAKYRGPTPRPEQRPS